MASTWRAAATVALIGLGLACACSSSRPTDFPDIILISVDSLRHDHLGAYGYARSTSPTIDRLAREGVLFESAVSTTSWTLPSHAALFTGLYDQSHGVTTDAGRLAESHLTLAEILRDAGYQTVGFYGTPYLHSSFGVAQGFEIYEGYNASNVEGDADWERMDDERFRRALGTGALESGQRITGPRAAAAVTAWLERADERPYFLFLHLWDVHFDYMPPERYVEMFDPGYEGDLDASNLLFNESLHAGMSARDLQHLIALYDGEIRLTDDTLGGILGTLEGAGRLDDSLIVFTADHGEEFFEHGNKGHRLSLFDEVLRVPLIITWPGHIEGGSRIADQVRLIDILPTLLSLAGIRVPAHVQGRDLTPLLEGRDFEPAPALAELHEQAVALRSNQYKLISNRGRMIFFDLANDPGEQKRLRRPPELASAMRETMARLEDSSRAIQARHDAYSTGSRLMEPGVRAQLHALGYLGE